MRTVLALTAAAYLFPVGEPELAACLRAVRRIPGVREVTNRLRAHAMPA